MYNTPQAQRRGVFHVISKIQLFKGSDRAYAGKPCGQEIYKYGYTKDHNLQSDLFAGRNIQERQTREEMKAFSNCHNDKCSNTKEQERLSDPIGRLEKTAQKNEVECREYQH